MVCRRPDESRAMPNTLLDPTEILATQMPPGKPLPNQPGGGGDVGPEDDEEEDDEEDG